MILSRGRVVNLNRRTIKNSVAVATVPHDTVEAIVFCIRQTLLDHLTEYVEHYGVPVKSSVTVLAGTFLLDN